MPVIATAGHVDHGKSALVRALTGRDPDRWEAEQRRGLTIDLGYAWTTLASAGTLAFVDVPGHRRFIGNMLAGLGPAPAVMLVVAADSGWSAQTQEHLLAIDALGVRHGLLVVTRSDLVDAQDAQRVRQAAAIRIAESSLGQVDSVVTSVKTGLGLEDLRQALDRVCTALPQPHRDGPVRLWIDRAFSVVGSGCVITGTLAAGRLRRGQRLEIGGRRVVVRGLQSMEQEREEVGATARVAVNLRGIEASAIARGAALVTPGFWPPTQVVDVRWAAEAVAGQVRCHVGTAAVTARVRPLGPGLARLGLSRPLPLHAGDALILRDPGQEGAMTGATVLDADPPPLHRRGDAARRALALAEPDADAPEQQVRRRGWVSAQQALEWGLTPPQWGAADAPEAVVRIGSVVTTGRHLAGWRDALVAAVEERAGNDRLDPHLPLSQARERAGIPDQRVAEMLCASAGLVITGGRVHRPGVAPELGIAAPAVAALLARLAEDPFAAPDRPELEAAGLGLRELAAAASLGQIVRLSDGIVLAPSAPAQAMRLLAALPQPFTTSAARQALSSTRRVVIPLLEELDRRGWTRRLDKTLREVARPSSPGPAARGRAGAASAGEPQPESGGPHVR